MLPHAEALYFATVHGDILSWLAGARRVDASGIGLREPWRIHAPDIDEQGFGGLGDCALPECGSVYVAPATAQYAANGIRLDFTRGTPWVRW